MLNKEVSGVIVARKGSKRILSKSMQKIGEKTLIQIKIDQLLRSGNIHRVIFGSDSDEMLDHAKKCGAEVVRRPDFFCDESQASANDMIGNMCDLIETDIVVWAHCTNPFISNSTYDSAVKLFLENEKNKVYDSLLSVVKIQEHLWGEDKCPLNYNPYAGRHVPARELPPYYMQDGGIFIQNHKDMRKNRYFFGKNPYLFEIPKEEFCDINDERDLICARAIFEMKALRNI